MKPRPLVNLLAFSSLFFAMLLPPEAYPDGKMAVILGATFVFLIALFERRMAPAFLKAGACVFAVLLLHTFVFSVDKYRSLETLGLAWAYFCLIGFFASTSDGSAGTLAVVIVVLSSIVSGYGLYQYFYGFDKIFAYISYSGADQIVKAPALNVIASRRVYSTLALPGTLWGFLVCAIPFHGMLWGRKRLGNIGLVVSMLMLLSTGFLTRSFGFLLGILVLAVCAAWLKNHRLLLNRAVPLILLLAIAGVSFYSARRAAIENADPVGLRFKNWVSAWNIFATHPLGTGLNTFGVVYPEYMQPGANETQFVHNTPLQLLSELGYPLIIATILLALWALKSPARTPVRHTRVSVDRFWLLLALAVWVTHNLVDINIYFGSVGVLGAVLIGCFCATPLRTDYRYSTAAVALTAAFSFGVILYSASVFIGGELQNRAQVEFESKKLPTAVQTLSRALRICPFNSSLYHDAGEIQLNLYHQTQNRQYLADATESFRREIQLSPEKAGAYVGYALCLSTANNVREAVTQIHTAQRLYPDSTYVQSIAQLMEQRLQ